MDANWFRDVATALAKDDEQALVGSLPPLLGDGAQVAMWRPGPEGWTHAAGAAMPTPADAPSQPGAAGEGPRRVLVAGEDPTARRLVVLDAPALTGEQLDAVALLVRGAVERLVAVETAAGAVRRLADNERIGQLGSYAWHVPTDTNRWSDELYRIYGEEPQSFNASYERFLGFIHPDDREKVAAIHQQAFATGEPYEMEERIVLADGTERLLWSNGEVIPGPDGSPELFIGICRDVTEQRAAERAAEEAAEHQQRVHDSELRRRAALELNDVVVQGLTAALWATETGAAEVAHGLVQATLADARRMMDDLLLSAGGEVPGAGELRRGAPPMAHLPPHETPTASEDGSEAAPADAAPSADPSAIRVVIADDAPDVRFLLSMRLGMMGIEVVGEAETGQQAVDLVEQHGPDVVLLDLSMPKMDGLEAARALRTAHPTLRIVVLSGYAADTMTAAALEAGADAYVEKGAELTEQLSSALGLTPV